MLLNIFLILWTEKSVENCDLNIKMKQFSLQKQKNLKIVQDAEKDIKYTRIFEDAYYTGKY